MNPADGGDSQDNKHSVLVMPPLSEGNVPLLSIDAKAMLESS